MGIKNKVVFSNIEPINKEDIWIKSIGDKYSMYMYDNGKWNPISNSYITSELYNTCYPMDVRFTYKNRVSATATVVTIEWEIYRKNEKINPTEVTIDGIDFTNKNKAEFQVESNTEFPFYCKDDYGEVHIPINCYVLPTCYCGTLDTSYSVEYYIEDIYNLVDMLNEKLVNIYEDGKVVSNKENSIVDPLYYCMVIPDLLGKGVMIKNQYDRDITDAFIIKKDILNRVPSYIIITAKPYVLEDDVFIAYLK